MIHPSRSQTLWQSIVLLLIFLLLLTTACTNKRTSTPKAPLPDISVATPLSQSVVLYDSYPAYLSSMQEVDLVARVDGYIEQQPFVAGSWVEQGDLLCVIEPSTYRHQYQEARANLQTAEAKLSYARSNYSRMEIAAQENAVSEISLLEAASDQRQAQAALLQAEAQLATAKTNLSYCYIRAPFAGKVSRNLYDVGAYVEGSVSPTTLTTIYNNDSLYAYFDIEDSRYMQMQRSGATDSLFSAAHPLIISLNDKDNTTYVAQLDYLSPSVELSTGTLTMRAVVPNLHRQLTGGLYVTIAVPYGYQSTAMLIDDASIGVDQLGKYIYLVNDSNRVVYRHIQVGGMVHDTLRIVTSGIAPTDKYVTKALLKVRPNMEVHPVLKKTTAKL